MPKEPTATVKQVGQIHFEGNIIPHTWYQHLVKEDGKPYLEAITILSDIVYWYRPRILRDEDSGLVVSQERKFTADKLQRSYGQLSKMFGLGKDQARNAVKYLRDIGTITVEFRSVVLSESGVVLSNVMFIEPVPEVLLQLNEPPAPGATPYAIQHIPPMGIEKTDTLSPGEQRGSPLANREGLPCATDTYTEITTKTSTKTTTTPAANAASLPPQPASSKPPSEEPQYGPPVTTYDPDEKPARKPRAPKVPAPKKPRDDKLRKLPPADLLATMPLERKLFGVLSQIRRTSAKDELRKAPPVISWSNGVQKQEWIALESGLKNDAERARISELIDAAAQADITSLKGFKAYVIGSWRNQGMKKPGGNGGYQKPDAVDDMRRFAREQGWGDDFVDQAIAAGAVTEADFARMGAIDVECRVLPE